MLEDSETCFRISLDTKMTVWEQKSAHEIRRKNKIRRKNLYRPGGWVVVWVDGWVGEDYNSTDHLN